MSSVRKSACVCVCVCVCVDESGNLVRFCTVIYGGYMHSVAYMVSVSREGLVEGRNENYLHLSAYTAPVMLHQ